MNRDWLDEMLDKHPGERASVGFLQRLMARIRHEERATTRRDTARRHATLTAAASLLFLAGFALGNYEPSLSSEADTETVSNEFLDNLDLLMDWELVSDEALSAALEEGGGTLDQ